MSPSDHLTTRRQRVDEPNAAEDGMAVEMSVATVESADGTRIAYERLGQGEGRP